MKKKGLIISTVVMVVVLIASLTTATYAWFTTSASVQVNPITLEVRSSAAVKVGVQAKAPAEDASPAYSDYLNGSVSVKKANAGNTVEWKGETPGLGSELQFDGLALGGDKAVGIGKAATKTGDKYNSDGAVTDAVSILTVPEGQSIIVAKGKGAEVTKDTVMVANANQDYLDATIGMQANDNGIVGMYVKVVVTTNDDDPALGVCASIHFIIEINGTAYPIEPFGASDRSGASVTGTTKDTAKDALANGNPSDGIEPAEDGIQCKSTFYFWVATTTDTKGFAQTAADIKNFRILAYIAGADPDCAERVTGGCTIEISFDGTTEAGKIKGEDGNLIAVTDSMNFLNTVESVNATPAPTPAA